MNGPLTEMPFLQHLVELREKLTKVAIGIAVMTCIALYFDDILFSLLTSPLREHFKDVQLIGTGPAEAFVVKLKTALVAGCILSSPWSFFQLWRFIAPGLHEHERRFALPFIAFSTGFFLAGVTFCFYVVFPFAFSFFADEFKSIEVLAAIKIGEYLEFAVKMLLVFGVVFELPIFCYFLVRLRLITRSWLVKQFRYAVVIIFIVAGVLTPPDVVTQILLAIPLLILYGLCILVAWYVERNRPAEPPAVI